jgi:hypothetical protein
MALQFCKEGHISKIASVNLQNELNFSKKIQSLTREKFTYFKKKMAEERRLYLFSKLSNKICNVVVDAGTFGGKSRLLCKVTRQDELKVLKDSKFKHLHSIIVEHSEFLISDDISTTSPISLNKKFGDKLNSKINKKYKLKYYSEEIQFATPSIFLFSEEGKKKSFKFSIRECFKIFLSRFTF